MSASLRKRGNTNKTVSVQKFAESSQPSSSHTEAVCDIVLFLAMCFHVFICPFTKVEESFNVQAMHDLIFYSSNITHFDHLEFPGVVPRSFLGPLAVVVSAFPIILPLRLFAPYMPRLFYLYVCRIALGTLGLAAYSALRRAVRSASNCPQFSVILTAITISQFHYLFYVSRPLANTFAMGIVAYACASLVNHHIRRAVWLLASVAVIFRCDTVLVSFPLLLWCIFSDRHGWPTRFWTVLVSGLQATFICICLTVAVDSYFWQTPLWPEGVVFKFNVIENRSSEWGTSPWHWYFSSALPRALLGSLLFIPVALLKSPFRFYRGILLSSLLFVVVYSKLPHKELRFLFPVLPLLNVGAALGFSWLWNQRTKGTVRKFAAYVSVCALIASLAVALGFLYVSSLNYPGGEALRSFHALYPTSESGAQIHIDNLAAISGVSRFGQEHNELNYVKTEHLNVTDFEKLGFKFLINGAREVPGFRRVVSVKGLVRTTLLPPRAVVEPVLYVFEAI